MKLGIMIEGQEGLTLERWRRIGGVVEDLGFESLWRSDHFMSLMGGTRDAPETWATLVQTALETRRIRFGPLVSPMTFRHPSLLTRMAATVDQLSDGRLVLGVGAGWNEREHQAYGLPFPPVRQRMEMLEEGIEVILRLQGDGAASYTGKHYQLDQVDMQPKPRQRPRIPLLVGGSGEQRILPLVARYADEWNMTGATPDRFRAKAAVLDEHCRAIGRNPAEIERSTMTAFLLGENEAALRKHCEAVQEVIPRLAQMTTSEIPAAAGEWGWLAGTPDDLIASLRALSAAGVERVMLQHHDQDNNDLLKLIATEVMPAVA
ncbi:MAG: LLM class F420-dependent oxidoreductase [Dehalococcoidia bacterium]